MCEAGRLLTIQSHVATGYVGAYEALTQATAQRRFPHSCSVGTWMQ